MLRQTTLSCLILQLTLNINKYRYIIKLIRKEQNIYVHFHIHKIFPQDDPVHTIAIYLKPDDPVHKITIYLKPDDPVHTIAIYLKPADPVHTITIYLKPDDPVHKITIYLKPDDPVHIIKICYIFHFNIIFSSWVGYLSRYSD
jgi:hypothetical protein